MFDSLDSIMVAKFRVALHAQKVMAGLQMARALCICIHESPGLVGPQGPMPMIMAICVNAADVTVAVHFDLVLFHQQFVYNTWAISTIGTLITIVARGSTFWPLPLMFTHIADIFLDTDESTFIRCAKNASLFVSGTDADGRITHQIAFNLFHWVK